MHEVIQLAAQVSAGIVEPLLVGDLITCLRLDDDGSEKEFLEFLCAASREAAEKYTNRCLRGSVAYQETYGRDRGSYQVDRVLQHEPFVLSRGPLLKITSVLVDGVALSVPDVRATGGENVLPKLYLPWSVGCASFRCNTPLEWA